MARDGHLQGGNGQALKRVNDAHTGQGDERGGTCGDEGIPYRGNDAEEGTGLLISDLEAHLFPKKKPQATALARVFVLAITTSHIFAH